MLTIKRVQQSERTPCDMLVVTLAEAEPAFATFMRCPMEDAAFDQLFAQADELPHLWWERVKAEIMAARVEQARFYRASDYERVMREQRRLAAF